jgi:predicted negative regulator of RcsB-dependent stress response
LGIGLPIQIEPLRQYALGTLSLRLADNASAATAAAKLERLAASPSATVLVRDLDRGLRARLTLQRGRPEEALRLLEAIEARDWQGDVAATPFVSRVNERFLRGEVLMALKRDADAEFEPVVSAARARLVKLTKSS